MNIAIVDDEQHCIDALLELLNHYSEHIDSIKTYGNVEAAVKGINSFKPDILFLDIQLQDQTGFDVLKQLRFKDFNLVFCTAFEQYAITAFKFSAMDYLLKPIAGEEFNETMEKLLAKSEKDALNGKMQVLMSHLESSGQQHKKICIPTIDGYMFLKMQEIIRCQADVNYTYIFTADQQKFVVSKTLKHFEDLLKPPHFFRIHNSHLVNMDYIQKYTKGKGGFVTLSDQTVLEVSTRRKDEFLRLCKLLEK